MNRCPNCAAQNREGAKFCTSCGFKLPAAPETPMAPFSDRSPFATTSTVPPSMDRNGMVQAEDPDQVDDLTTVQSFSTWGAQTEDDSIELPGPALSWDAEPPKDTAVPVSDEMIETLVCGFPPESPEVGAPPDDIEAQLPVEQSDDHGADELQASIEQPTAVAQSPSTSQPNIDHLLKIARELEYGLIELAENLPAESALTTETGPVDASRGLVAHWPVFSLTMTCRRCAMRSKPHASDRAMSMSCSTWCCARVRLPP